MQHHGTPGVVARFSNVSIFYELVFYNSADRSSLNGTLKYLRQKLRKAQKIQKQDQDMKLQSKLNLADSA